jgi:hypothetical protein
MRISVSYNTGRTETSASRLLDGQRRTLVIQAPWRQPPAQTVASVWNQLTEQEQREVVEAFGLDGATIATSPQDPP